MADSTKLTYSVAPNLVYCSRSTGDSIITLYIGAGGPTGEPVKIRQIVVKVPVGPAASDLTNGEMNSVSIQREWEFKKYLDYYRAKPINPATKVAGSVSFELSGVKVNLEQGTALIEIIETDEDGDENSRYFSISKIRSKLDIDLFDATAKEVTSGEPVTLTWKTSAASSVKLFPGEYTDLSVNGSVVVRPLTTTTYTLTAVGAGPEISKQYTVMVPPPQINRFEPSVHEVNAGDIVRLEWNVANATEITLSPGFEHERQEPVGFKEVRPATTTTYVLTAKNKALQTQERHETVKINPVEINSFKVTPNSELVPGDTVELSWNLQSATSAVIAPIGLNIPADQLKTGTYKQVVHVNTDYTLTAQNGIGPKIANARVPLAKGWHTVATDAPLESPSTRYRPITLNFDGKIWVIHPKLGLIYNSADGRTWNSVQRSGAQLWQLRDEIHGCVFNGKMWLIGGADGFSPVVYHRDVWSSTDGVTWQRVTGEAPWAGRVENACFVFGNKMFISGGAVVGSGVLNDVWSSADGSQWQKETDNAFKTPLSSHKIVVFDNQAWAISCSTTNEVYASKNGKDWALQTAPLSWAGLTYKKFSCIVANDALYAVFNDRGNFEIEMHKMEFGSIWQRVPVPQHMQTADTLWLSFRNMPWSFGGSINYQSNRNVVVLIP